MVEDDEFEENGEKSKEVFVNVELSKEDEVDGNASLDNGNEVDYFTVEEDG